MQELRINIAVLTSQQILESFLRLLGLPLHGEGTSQESRDKSDEALLSLLQSLWIVVPSVRVQDVAKAAGFRRVIQASGADDESILDSLSRSGVQAEDV